MNKKIKITVITVLMATGLLIGNFSTAAGLSVCGETGQNANALPDDKTNYDNYKDYQAEVLVLAAQRDAKIAALRKALPASPSTAEQDAYQNKVQQIKDQYASDDNKLKDKYNICQPKDIFKQIARITNFLIGFIGIFVIVRLVISGFQMVMSQGSEEAIKGAKSGITNALIGLVLVFGAYILINILFQVFGIQNFGINPFGK